MAYGIKTHKNNSGHDELDIRDWEYPLDKTRDEIMRVVRSYANWAPFQIPDVVIMRPDQRAMFPSDINFLTTSANVMEIVVRE